jgi:diguanylate cyclase (GGDEF)-like protein
LDKHEILIVDDSPMVVDMFADMFEGNGYHIRKAENGRAALERIAERRPDLILLDVMMPEMDGYEVCRTLRAQEGDYIPVLMITAPGDLALSLNAGADDFISKPPAHAELIARSKSLLRIRDLQKRLYEQNLGMHAQNEQLQGQNQQLEAMSTELHARNQELQAMTTQLQVLNQELELLTVTDGLTKAYNHRHFQERLRSEFARARRHHEPLSCVLIDVDRFKRVNDTHGHLVGDEVLVRLVEILKEGVRREDFVARYGGEEFALLLPKTPAGQAHHLAERLRAKVEAEALEVANANALRFTISLGVAEFLRGGSIQDPDGLIDAADKALFRAKKRGRNRVEVATETNPSAAST